MQRRSKLDSYKPQHSYIASNEGAGQLVHVATLERLDYIWVKVCHKHFVVT
jgi:hypothetical protein